MMTTSAATSSGAGTGASSRDPLNNSATQVPQPSTRRPIATGVTMDRGPVSVTEVDLTHEARGNRRHVAPFVVQPAQSCSLRTRSAASPA